MSNPEEATEQSDITRRTTPQDPSSDREWQQQMFEHNRTYYDDDLATEWKEDVTIRLLKLHPGEFDDPIQGTLISTWMDSRESRPLLYDAVSYTWGKRNTGNGYSITLGGKPGFQVTRNAFWALRRIRRRRQPRDVWLDAVCIDQTNLAEKSQQVDLMPRIYSEARSVLCWFGPCGSYPAEEVEECPDHTLRRKQRSRNKEIVSKRSPLLRVTSDHTGEWWTRIWTVQECCLGKRVKVLIGCHTFDYAVVKDTLDGQDYLNGQPGRVNELWPIELTSVGDLLGDRDDIMPSSPNHAADARMEEFSLELLRCIESTMDCDATEPKDKIFALLGMCDTRMKPDYTKSLLEVCIQAAADIFESEDSLEILINPAWLHFDLDSCSWVPNFGTRREDIIRLNRFQGCWEGDAAERRLFRTADMDEYRSRSEETDLPVGQIYVGGQMLTIEAIRFDYVLAVTRGDEDYSESVKLACEYFTQVGSPYADHMAAFERTWKTAVTPFQRYESSNDGSDDSSDDELERDSETSSDTGQQHSLDGDGVVTDEQESDEWLTDSSGSQSDSTGSGSGSPHSPSLRILDSFSSDSTDSQSRRKRLTARRSSRSSRSEENDHQDEPNPPDRYCLFITSRGYYGVGYSPNVSVGDEVALIVSVSRPVVLRPSANGYQLIVDAYVHGVSNGEIRDSCAGPEAEYNFQRIVLC